jgi:DNA-binding NtrC family response regulator
VKLLRALQEGEVDPVGAKMPVKVNIRLISATNKDLLKLAQSGHFREDLYYRLNVFPINMPPLRDRMEDVPALVEHFIQRFSIEEGKKIAGIEQKALDVLAQYQWPGNVRQLENTVFRAVVLCENEKLVFNDFPQIAGALGLEQAEPDRSTPSVNTDGSVSLGAGSASVTNIASANGSHEPEAGAINAVDTSGHLRPLEEIEGEMIQLAIETYSGHMSEVARRLGIGRSTLYRKVKELGLDKRAS